MEHAQLLGLHMLMKVNSGLSGDRHRLMFAHVTGKKHTLQDADNWKTEQDKKRLGKGDEICLSHKARARGGNDMLSEVGTN